VFFLQKKKNFANVNTALLSGEAKLGISTSSKTFESFSTCQWKSKLRKKTLKNQTSVGLSRISVNLETSCCQNSFYIEILQIFPTLLQIRFPQQLDLGDHKHSA